MLRRAQRGRVLAVLMAAVTVAVVVVTLAARGGPTAPAPAATDSVMPALPGLPLVALPPVPEVASSPLGTSPLPLLTTLAARHRQRADLQLALGAQALIRGDRPGALRAFTAASRLRSAAAAVALAVAGYDRAQPRRSLAALAALEHGPTALFARYEYGVVALWSGQPGAAAATLRALRDADPEGFYGVKADDLLHPQIQPGYPVFVPQNPAASSDPAVLTRLAQQHPTDARTLVDYATALLSLGQRRNATMWYERAVAASPGDVEARVGLAISLFAKDDGGSRALAMLGQLTATYPDSASSRFHLALVELWVGQKDQARAQWEQLVRQAPASVFAVIARRIIQG